VADGCQGSWPASADFKGLLTIRSALSYLVKGFETSERIAESGVLNWPFWLTRCSGSWTSTALICLVVAGCAATNQVRIPRPASPDILEQAQSIDLTARSSQRIGPANSVLPDRGPQSQTYYGDNSASPLAIATGGDDGSPPTTGALSPSPERSSDGYEFNFENAPIPTVAKTILGDILSVGYTIDPRVQGTVSLSSGRPVPKKDVLFVLESALRVSNVALVRDGKGYRLIPAAEAVGSGSVDGASDLEPGYGVTVVPLKYVSAQTLTKLLDSFATKAGSVRADAGRNLVVIQGSTADRRAAIETVKSFDADWMRGQSVGIYPVSNSSPEPVITELERIIDAGEGGLSQDLIKLQPIARQNAILVVARKPDLLKSASTWIARLDKAGSAGTGVKVYRMRYGDARQVAELLSNIFTGGSSGSELEAPSNQLVPGGGAIASTSERLGLGSSPPGGNGQQLISPTSSQQLASAGSSNQRLAIGPGGRFSASLSTTARNSSGLENAVGPTPILPGVRITADPVNNALLIYANQENYRIIERTLQQLDRPQLQVAIDATIAEVTLNDNLSYGVQFFLKSNNLGLPVNSGSIVNTASSANDVASSTTGALLSRVLPGFNFLAGTEANPQIILNALHAVTDVKILSTPSLVVVNNQVATLQVGDSIPITTGTATVLSTSNTVVNTVDYRNTGVILNVAPRVNANGNVLLDVEQEISNVADNANATTLTPTVSERKVKSSIAVATGQTVLLAGLISETQNRGRSGIPGLDQIPGIGALLSNNTGTAQRTELIIFIRPQIIRNGVDAERIAEQLRAKMMGRFSSDPSPMKWGPGRLSE
jgi:general secretion pathway protein D